MKPETAQEKVWTPEDLAKFASGWRAGAERDGSQVSRLLEYAETVTKALDEARSRIAELDSIDVIDRAYFTASGDLFCTRCGRRYAEEEVESDEWFDDYQELP